MKQKSTGTASPSLDIAGRAKEILLAEPDLKLALVYGSAASGTLRADSDVDIAVLFDAPLSAEKKVLLAERLSSSLRRTVDLVDLFSLTGTILQQILCKGQVLIKRRSEYLAGQIKKMVYDQADMMPYVRRTLCERQQRFIHGS